MSVNSGKVPALTNRTKTNNATGIRDSSSFRDNRGFIMRRGGQVYRQIDTAGREAYDHLMASGLYQALTDEGLLVPHQEASLSEAAAGAYKLLRPEQVPIISYPYEWSFSQLQDAALATLRIQQRAMDYGMTLRDATAYNIQFVGGRPLLIDTLSFDIYAPGQPWQAYRQYCQHFLAPLALMSQVDLNLSQLLRVYIDGIPLPLASKLLPLKAKTRLGLLTHIGLHAGLQRRHESTGASKLPPAQISQTSVRGLVDSLDRTTRALKPPHTRTEWGAYYDNTNYSDASRQDKQRLVGEYLKRVNPERVLDLGANDGTFSRIAAAQGAMVICADIDPLAVESNYQTVKASGETLVLPLLIDLTNPSPDLGWANAERSRFAARAGADAVLALALVHHLAIGNNVPLPLVASYLASLGPTLIIEFVPKTDSQVQRLLATREDIFPNYSPAGFEAAFSEVFDIVDRHGVQDSERIMYLMNSRTQP